MRSSRMWRMGVAVTHPMQQVEIEAGWEDILLLYYFTVGIEKLLISTSPIVL